MFTIDMTDTVSLNSKVVIPHTTNLQAKVTQLRSGATRSNFTVAMH